MIIKYISVIVLSFSFIVNITAANESKKIENNTENNKNKQKYELSENCLISYREIREELHTLKSCKKTADCAVVFFTFPFGPETCIFYGVNTPEGKKNKEIVENRITKFTQQCSKNKPDYQAWLKESGGKFKITAQDCISGKMFSECIEGKCVTKFGYDIDSKRPIISDVPNSNEI